MRQRAAGTQLFAVATYEKQAVIRARPVKNHDGEYFADVDEVDPWQQRHQRQELERNPHRYGDGRQRHHGQQRRTIDAQQNYDYQDYRGQGGVFQAVAASLGKVPAHSSGSRCQNA